VALTAGISTTDVLTAVKDFGFATVALTLMGIVYLDCNKKE